MPEYRVTWIVELGAEGPLEAAMYARDWQLDPENEASCFEVHEYESGKTYQVDVLEDLDDPNKWKRTCKEIAPVCDSGSSSSSNGA